MKKYLVFSIFAVALAACQIDIQSELPAEQAGAGAPASFNVVSPDTKTTLDGLHVYWAEGDKIRVYGHNTDSGTYTDNGTYTISSGAGTASAVFTKDDDGALTGTYDEYYAIYPGNLTATVSSSSIVFPRLNASPNHFRQQNPPAGGFDPNLAVMTAKSDGGSFAFRYGVGFIKLTIPEDGVTKVDINLENNCIGDTPTYNASTGALSTLGNSNKQVTSAEGSFVKDESYYFAVVPRDGYTIGNLTITLTGGSTFTTSHFSGKKVTIGNIFNLGKPAKATSINATNPEKLAYDATSGSFTFSIINPDGISEPAVALKSGSWINNTVDDKPVISGPVAGVYTVSFNCSANGGSEDREAVITLSYAGAADKDVTIRQGIAGAVTVHKDWDFSSSAWQTVLSNNAGTAKDYNQSGWTVTLDDLTYTSGSGNGKWSASGYIQPNGAGDTTKRVFTYTAPADGTLTVTAASASSGNTRDVAVKCGSSAEVAKGCDAKTDLEFDVTEGVVYIYPKNGIRFYRIRFDTN